MTRGWRSGKALLHFLSTTSFQVVFLATPLSAIVLSSFLSSFPPRRKHNLISSVSAESGDLKSELEFIVKMSQMSSSSMQPQKIHCMNDTSYFSSPGATVVCSVVEPAVCCNRNMIYCIAHALVLTFCNIGYLGGTKCLKLYMIFPQFFSISDSVTRSKYFYSSLFPSPIQRGRTRTDLKVKDETRECDIGREKANWNGKRRHLRSGEARYGYLTS